MRIIDAVEEKPYSPGMALGLSLTATAASYGALIYGGRERDVGLALTGVAGIFVAPSVGHFYANNSRGAWKGMGVRALGALTSMVATMSAMASDCTNDCHLYDLFIYGGQGMIVASGIYDVVTAPRAARRGNERHRKLLLSPVPMAGPSNQKGMGLALSGTF